MAVVIDCVNSLLGKPNAEYALLDQVMPGLADSAQISHSGSLSRSIWACCRPSCGLWPAGLWSRP